MKIRNRIFLVFAILIVAGIYSLVQWMHSEMRPRYMEAQEDTLVDTTQLLASMVSEHAIKQESNGRYRIDPRFFETSFRHLYKQVIDAQIYQLHKQHVDVRLYVTNRKGIVIFDSDKGRDLGADYSQWRDVNLTLRGEYGARSTEADPLYPEGSTMYIAAPIHHKGDIIGTLTLGKPTINADLFMDDLIHKSSYVAFVIATIAILIGLGLHAWLTRPLNRLQGYAKNVAQGKRVSLPTLGQNEVAEVGDAIESMRQALDGKSYVTDYVQALTHELKAPVAGIRGSIELLLEGLPAEDQRRFLNIIQNETDRIQELIDRLLELAALEYRPVLSDLETIDLVPVVRQAINSLEALTAQNKVDINLKAPESAALPGEPFLIAKALTNILKNAIEFSPEGKSIDVVVEQTDTHTSITIRDHGPGIPEYAMDKAFDRFYSLKKPSGQKGSGLGLSFVKEIAALHQASVDIHSIRSSNASGTYVTLVFGK